MFHRGTPRTIPVEFSRNPVTHSYVEASDSLFPPPDEQRLLMEKHLTTASLSYPLDRQGIAARGQIFANLGTSPLVEHAVRNGEGLLAKDGPFVVATGKHTGRSPRDKFIVRDATTESTVWWGNVNRG
jgi:hypothetical protein